MTWPPRAPASGPISTIQSASRRICVSWSTRSTELPSATRSCITPVSPTMLDGMQTDGRLVQHVQHARSCGCARRGRAASAGARRWRASRRSGRARDTPSPRSIRPLRRGGERLADALRHGTHLVRAGCSGTPRTHSASSLSVMVQASSSEMPRSLRRAGGARKGACRRSRGRHPPSKTSPRASCPSRP